jgi:hypothetical protein
LYVSFRYSDGSWSDPSELVTGFEIVAQPWITIDGKYILFTVVLNPTESDICWMDTGIIRELKPREL